MEEFYNLISKYLNKNISSIDKALLNEKLKESDENKMTFKSILKIDRLKRSQNIVINTKADWDNIHKKITHKKRVRQLQIGITTIAASILLIMVARYVSTNNTSTDNWHTATTTSAITQEIVLSDGSKIVLNKNSELTYPLEFTKETREVKLIGEAYFNIAHMPNKPFIVTTQNTSTRVLGTSFNITSYPHQNTEHIQVFSGKVEYKDKYQHQTILTKNMSAKYSKTSHTISPSANNTNVLSWQNKEFRFKNKTLEYVLTDLQKVYNFNYSFASNKWQNQLITTGFNNLTIDQIMELLSESLGFNYHTTNNTIIIE